MGIPSGAERLRSVSRWSCLQKQRDEQGNETLSDLDKLYVVHVNSGKSKEKWDVGGPILPRLSTALANYPHTIIELEVRFDKQLPKVSAALLVQSR